jgi:hypothetical protein
MKQEERQEDVNLILILLANHNDTKIGSIDSAANKETKTN